MNCSDVRFALAAEPSTDDAAVAAHLERCAACAAYAREMLELDRRLKRAMDVAVPDGALPTAAAPLEVVRPLDPAGAPAPRAADPTAARPRRYAAPLALAASVAAVAVLVALLWGAFPRESLASAVVDHMSHEPYAWSATVPMSVPAVAEALARTGVRVDPALEDVTYAETCWLRGRWVPHLVVRSPAGPVTIIVLPHESVAARVPFDEAGYRGVLVPAERGSIAVLTRESADVDAVAAQALAAVRYAD